jgi:hypothetical protein
MRSRVLILLAIFTLSFSTKLNAQIDINNAKAIFIYNFLSYVKWPDAEVNGKYIIGVLGQTTTYDFLKKATADRLVGKNTIEVIQFNTLADAKDCHVLVIAFNKSSEIDLITNKYKGKSCLIVGEKSGLTDKGAVVHFELAGDKLKYKIDPTNAKAHNLIVSKTLLNMSL